jgi:hypothetical protein
MIKINITHRAVILELRGDDDDDDVEDTELAEPRILTMTFLLCYIV